MFNETSIYNFNPYLIENFLKLNVQYDMFYF